MAVITSVVLVAPIVGPLSGAALMHFIHWKALFGIIAAMGLVAWLGLLLTMPETVRRGDVPFSPVGVLRDFRNVFRNRIFTRRRHAVAELYSADELGGGIAGDFNGRRRTDHQRVRLEPGAGLQRRYHRQPVGGALGKDPTRPRFVLSAVPVQMLGLAILIVGNLVWPHVWLWSVLGTCFYAFGIGLIFPTLFRFTLFSNDLPKGTVSASLNIVILSVSALSIEGARWLWFHGGRLPSTCWRWPPGLSPPAAWPDCYATSADKR